MNYYRCRHLLSHLVVSHSAQAVQLSLDSQSTRYTVQAVERGLGSME